MPIYRVDLVTPEGLIMDCRFVDCDDDDAAIDHAGEIDYRHEVLVWDSEGERLVAKFKARA
jgi:hypothetical protein